MAKDYRSIGLVCSNLKRIGELEVLMKAVSSAKSREARLYQEEHNRLMVSVNDYLAKNYPNGSFDIILDIWQYMQERQQEKVDEAVLAQAELMEKERETQRKERDELVAKIEDFRAFLRDHYQIK